MKILIRISSWFYNQGLNLYPYEFKSEFRTEMEYVFLQAIKDQMEAGSIKALIFCLKELRDLPGSLIREHWMASKTESITMSTKSEITGRQDQSDISKPGSWGATFMAGIPHFLMGLLFGVGKILSDDIYHGPATLINILALCLGLLVIILLITAWRRGWPLWSASWYLYGTWVGLVIFGLGIEKLDLDEQWRYTNAMFFGWILFCIIGYFILITKSKLHSLVAIAFFFPMLGIMFLEFIPNPIEGWLAIGLGSLSGLIVASVVRVGEFRSGLWSVLTINIIASLSIAYVNEYQMKDLPPNIPAHIPNFGNFLAHLIVYTFIGLGVVMVPFILRNFWNFTRTRISS